MKKILSLALLYLFLTACVAENTDEHAQQEPTRILITGSLSPQGMERIGKPLNVVSSEELQAKQATSIGEALSDQVGISSTAFGPGASRPVIRGQGKERVRVLENGLENGDVSATSDDHAITNDPLGTSRIDILRGPSTLMFGSQAIGGVVNIIDNSIAEENIDKDLTGKINLTGGDRASDEFSGALELKGQVGELNWYLSGYGRDTDNIEIPGFAESSRLREQEEEEHHHEEEEHHDEEEEHEEGEDHHDEEEEHHDDDEEARGTLENSDTESYGFKAGLSKVWKNGFFGMAIKHHGSDYGIPGGHSHAEAEEEGEDHHEEEEEEEEEEHGEEPVRIDLEQTRIETRGAVHLHEGFLDTIRFGLSYSDYEHKELEGTEVGTTYDRKAFETRVLFTHHHDDYLEGGLGLQINYDDLSAKGAEAFIPSTETFSPAIFLVEDFAINDSFIWQLGGRYENSNLDPVGHSSENFNVYSASTGVIWHSIAKDYSAALNFSYSERAPNATELFANGVHVSSQIFEIGDNTLDKESSLGAELILRKRTGKTKASFTAFIQDYDDYINLAPSGTEEEAFPVFEYQNIDARFWGFEAEVEQALIYSNGHLLNLFASFDLVRARDTNNSQNLPRITPARTKLGMDYSYDILKAFIEGVFVEEQDKTAEFELATDSYTILNTGVDLNVLQTDELNLNLFVKGTNLTDEEARVHTSFLKDRAPLRGRAFFAGLTAKF